DCGEDYESWREKTGLQAVKGPVPVMLPQSGMLRLIPGPQPQPRGPGFLRAAGGADLREAGSSGRRLGKSGSKASDRLRPRMVALTRPHAVASPYRRADEVDCKPPVNNGERRLHEFPSPISFFVTRKSSRTEGPRRGESVKFAC